MPFEQEKKSDSFGVPNIEIKQSLSSSFDVFSGINIFSPNPINTEENILKKNVDGRLPLGLFFYEDENFLKNNFVDEIRGSIFTQVPISSRNLVNNSTGKKIRHETNMVDYEIDEGNSNFIYMRFPTDYQIVWPEGGWGYVAYDGIGGRIISNEQYGEVIVFNQTFNTFVEEEEWGENYINNFLQSSNTLSDIYGELGYAGYYPYYRLFAEYWNTQETAAPSDYLNQLEKFYKLIKYPAGPGGSSRNPWSYAPFSCDYIDSDITNLELNQRIYYPNIAKWVKTNEAYIDNVCLEICGTDWSFNGGQLPADHHAHDVEFTWSNVNIDYEEQPPGDTLINEFFSSDINYTSDDLTTATPNYIPANLNTMENLYSDGDILRKFQDWNNISMAGDIFAGFLGGDWLNFKKDIIGSNNNLFPSSGIVFNNFNLDADVGEYEAADGSSINEEYYVGSTSSGEIEWQYEDLAINLNNLPKPIKHIIDVEKSWGGSPGHVMCMRYDAGNNYPAGWYLYGRSGLPPVESWTKLKKGFKYIIVCGEAEMEEMGISEFTWNPYANNDLNTITGQSLVNNILNRGQQILIDYSNQYNPEDFGDDEEEFDNSFNFIYKFDLMSLLYGQSDTGNDGTPLNTGYGIINNVEHCEEMFKEPLETFFEGYTYDRRHFLDTMDVGTSGGFGTYDFGQNFPVDDDYSTGFGINRIMAPTTSGGNQKWPILLKMEKNTGTSPYNQIRNEIIPYRNPIDIDEITHILPNGDDLSDASDTQVDEGVVTSGGHDDSIFWEFENQGSTSYDPTLLQNVEWMISSFYPFLIKILFDLGYRSFDDVLLSIPETDNFLSIENPEQYSLNNVNNNQYRVLNQVQKIYDSTLNTLNPYSILTVSFKMKTMSNLYNISSPPRVEVGIVTGEGLTSDPRRTTAQGDSDINGTQTNPFPKNFYYHPAGYFNSKTYSDDIAMSTYPNISHFGSRGVFTNTTTDTWEEFSFNFSLSDYFQMNNNQKVKDLHLIIQSANDFRGLVYLDDFKVFESYEFYPDVDVRKKKSSNDYGIGDLTEYYDKKLQPEEYNDTTAPLEAQFYFYPTYPTENLFDVKRTPMYNDFKKGFFYIYDVDWGDGSPKEFTSEPIQINEESSLYHTYEKSGIFEVTGYMLRMKPDENDLPIGVIHNKKFNLRININEGLDGDFTYFGSDGFPFIPYKNTSPIIGGYSDESMYYKSIKRQLGFVGNEKTFVKFANDGDKLKTELALLKMDSSDLNNLEILPNYLIKRHDEKPYIPFLYPRDLDVPFTNPAGQVFPPSNYLFWTAEDMEINSENIPDRVYGILLDIPSGAGGSAVVFRDENGEFVGSGDPGNSSDLFNITTTLSNASGFKWAFAITPGSPFYWDVFEPYLELNGEIVNNGLSTIRDELGKGIGDCDLTNIKYYNTPKSIHELFGFDEEDLEIIGKPDELRYWKNIIPQNMSIFERQGIDLESNPSIDIYSEQDWLDENDDGQSDYYYPVLPRYGANGKFIDEDFPNNKIPFPLEANITNENESNENLLLNITNRKVETNVFNDKSGNKNYGFNISDYKPLFNNKTFQPENRKTFDRIKTSAKNGAF